VLSSLLLKEKKPKKNTQVDFQKKGCSIFTPQNKNSFLSSPAKLTDFRIIEKTQREKMKIILSRVIHRLSTGYPQFIHRSPNSANPYNINR